MTPLDTIAGLRAARALVEKGWTQKAFARDAQNHRVPEFDPAAVKWCMGGACFHADIETSGRLLGELQDELQINIVDYNDAPDRTQADVLALFDRCIARLEAQAAS